VMKTIDKVGGLDNYLLGEKRARIKDLGPKGWTLRWKLMQTPAIADKFNQQRRELGLPEALPQEREQLQQDFEDILARKPSKEHRAERFRRFNLRPDIWRNQPMIQLYGSMQAAGIATLLEKSQIAIEELQGRYDALFKFVDIMGRNDTESEASGLRYKLTTAT